MYVVRGSYNPTYKTTTEFAAVLCVVNGSYNPTYNSATEFGAVLCIVHGHYNQTCNTATDSVGRRGGKTIPVTGRGSLYGCEMLRIQRCLDNRLVDGDKVVSPMQQHFTHQKHYLL
jgi:hypothetical protein